MAKAVAKRKVAITLTLSENEAMFIKDLCQNSFDQEERVVIRDMRESIFNALKNALEGAEHGDLE